LAWEKGWHNLFYGVRPDFEIKREVVADTDIELTQQQRDEIAAKIAGLQNSEMPHSLVASKF